MKPTIIAAAVFGLVLAHAAPSRADARFDLEEHLHSNMRRLNSGAVEELQEYSKCRAMLAKAKGLAKGTRLASPNFEKHPKGVQVDGAWTITVADVPWICDQIDLTIARGSLMAALESARSYQKMLDASPPPDERAGIDEGAYSLALAKTCAAQVDKEAAGGATAIEWKGASVPIADARALCTVLQKWGEYQNASGEANFEKVAPPYRALGVNGERLRLFVQYADVSFRGKRCEKIDDLAVLAKAKYVYQWLENDDGTHTIRKYTFSGNKYKVSEKRYITERAAYAGCK